MLGSTWKSASGVHWVAKRFNSPYDNLDGYITCTADLDTNTLKIYWNGEYVDETKVEHSWMIGGGLDEKNIPFVIGFQTGGDEYSEAFSKMNIYACRLYNKVLTSDEVKNNYTKTVEYRKVLTKNNN